MEILHAAVVSQGRLTGSCRRPIGPAEMCRHADAFINATDPYRMQSYRVGWRRFGVQEVEIEDGTHECTWLLAGEILRCCCAIKLSVLILEQCTSLWRNEPKCCTAPATAPITEISPSSFRMASQRSFYVSTASSARGNATSIKSLTTASKMPTASLRPIDLLPAAIPAAAAAAP